MRTAYFALTDEAEKTAKRICDMIGGDIFRGSPLREKVRECFDEYDALVFVMAAGIVVRTIAPLIKSKQTDPAVIVVDQSGKFVISLLSGHLGGANRLTKAIAEKIGAAAVITTATDIQGVISFDEFAKDNGLVIENIAELKYISGAVLRGDKAELVTSCDVDMSDIPDEVKLTDAPTGNIRVVVSDVHNDETDTGAEHILYLRPKTIVVGIGCKRNTPFSRLEKCFLEFIAEYKICIHSVFAVSTIALKKDEDAILKLCDKYNLELKIISEDEIKNCPHRFEESSFVKEITGVPSVAQASSYIASGNGKELTGKVRFDGITMAACRKKHEKLIFGRRY